MKGKNEKDCLENRESMTRRDFVKLSSLGVLTVGILKGCGGVTENPVIEEPDPVSLAVDPSPASFPQSIASGEPRDNSMVFWTRVNDEALPGQDYEVQLVIALDEGFTNIVMEERFTARVEFDGVLKVQVIALASNTTYYYQFQYVKGSSLLGSNIGRTRTAPLPFLDLPVRFGFISCQDYKGRWYNTLSRMAEMDLDFVIHLGDYIYETTNGSVFQGDTDSERRVGFSDEEGAIDLGGSLAARSLSNYRDIYKTFKSDPMLQKVHERFPMISIWDDHEFSNDSWRASGNYFGGIREEWDEDRKRNAERAYAEYMPTAFGINARGNLAPGDETFYPNTRIYRDFFFGRNVHLMMTDQRSFRPDHLIPEDAFPATIVVDQSNLAVALFSQGILLDDNVKAVFDAYIQVDEPEYGAYKQVFTQIMTQQYESLGMAPERAVSKAGEVISGLLGINYLNGMLEAFNAAQPGQALPLLERTDLDVGVSYMMLGKTGPIAGNGIGSRNFVVKDTYDLVSALGFRSSQGASEDVLGQDQEEWLRNTFNSSRATWRLVGSSVSFTSLLLDLRDNPLVPPLFRQRFYVAVDQWDGFPNKRQQLLELFASHPQQNTVILSGDIHASHAARHGNGTFEFTVCGVSSQSFKGLLRSAVQVPPFTELTGIRSLVENAESLFLQNSPVIDEDRQLKQMAFTRTDVCGFAVVEVDRQTLTTTFHHLDEPEVLENQYDSQNLDAKFTEVSFEVFAGELSQRF